MCWEQGLMVVVILLLLLQLNLCQKQKMTGFTHGNMYGETFKDVTPVTRIVTL